MGEFVYGVGINDLNININSLDFGRKIYNLWTVVLQRCYDQNYHKIKPTYKECTISGEWMVFSNFYKYVISKDWKNKQLDKDILFDGNKIYSKETCCFVSTRVNNLFIKSDFLGLDLPIGVTKYYNKFLSQCNDGSGTVKRLGAFDTPEEAHFSYCTFKADVIRKVANSKVENLEKRIKYALLLRADLIESHSYYKL